MPNIPGLIAGSLAVVDTLSGLFDGGDDVDPELMQLQKDIGKALLSDFQTQSTIRNPFQAALSNQLKARTGKELPLSQISLGNMKSPLENVVRRSMIRNPQASGGRFNVDGSRNMSPSSFLGGRAQRGGVNANSIAPLLMAAIENNTNNG